MAKCKEIKTVQKDQKENISLKRGDMKRDIGRRITEGKA